jgi:addiction module RelE/StbE family toxin
VNVFIRESAYDDLERIHAWIKEDRPRSADSVIDRILESTEQLDRFPYIGRIGRAPGTYELVVPGLPYIVVYQVNAEDEVVIVIGVFHGAQDR